MRRTLLAGPVLGVALAAALVGCGSISPAGQASGSAAAPAASLSLRAIEAPVTLSSPADLPATMAPATTTPAQAATPPTATPPAAAAHSTPPPAAVAKPPAPKPPAPKPPAPKPPAPKPAPPPAPAGCHPLTDGGTCYQPGEFCRASDHGVTGLAGDGKVITCEDNDGWRWEPQ